PIVCNPRIGSAAASRRRNAWPGLDCTSRRGTASVPATAGAHEKGFWPFGEVYLSTEIPQRVKDAQCELALALLQGFDDGAEDQMNSFSADRISINFSTQRPSGSFPPSVAQLLSGLVSGNVLMRA